MNSLLLFDIDGTLIDTEGAGLHSLEEGFFHSFPDHSEREFPELDLGGATDGSVIAFLFEHFQIEDHEDHRAHFFQHYEKSLERRLKVFGQAGKGRVLPGIPDLLMELSRRHQDFVLALLTGNTEAGARIKLQSYGLDSYFPLGAYGSDHHDRNALGPIAIDRAEKAMGRPYPAAKALVIGDTEKDIACARACGAKVVAVATGAAPLDQLEAQAPDGILDDLSDVPRAIALFEELLEL